MRSLKSSLSLVGLSLILLALATSCTEYVGTAYEQLEMKLIDNNDYGKLLVTKDNQSMYIHAGDVTGETNCTGGCNDTWPAVTGEVYDMELGEGLSLADFGTIDLEDGKKQVTYKGWPLYYYSPTSDGELEKPLETKGEGRGGVFHLAKPDYTILLGRKAVVENEPEKLDFNMMHCRL